MKALYDRIGCGYTTQRRSDPRIFVQIRRLLQGISSLLDVGAGSGSYEPDDMAVVAVEPSLQMILQHPHRSNVVQAKAEALPFSDNSFDATMALLTIHHWQDQKKCLEECARVTRSRVVILTWDPASDGFWLVQDYFPGLLALDRKIFPKIEDIRSVLGDLSIQPLPIPADCMDGFLGAYWHRPHFYLDSKIRSCISSFSRITVVEPRLEELREDLAAGVWERKNRQLLMAETLDIGYRLITAEIR
jgi:SAM-dependent methyltransferase